jgi:hypothetical protein
MADAAAPRPRHGLALYLLGLVLLAAVSAGACGAIRVAHRTHGGRSVAAAVRGLWYEGRKRAAEFVHRVRERT